MGYDWAAGCNRLLNRYTLGLMWSTFPTSLHVLHSTAALHVDVSEVKEGSSVTVVTSSFSSLSLTPLSACGSSFTNT